MTNHDTSKVPAAIPSDAEFDHIKISPNSTFDETHNKFTLTEGGTWENKLIDLTADGAAMSCLILDYSNWHVRNVAIIGTNESTDGDSAWWIQVPDSTGSATIENIYMPHGDGGGHTDYGNPRLASNMFVHKYHAGHLTINGMYTGLCSDNGIYASAMGPENNGSLGEVVIKNSYADNCAVADFRVTDGSTVKNCVGVGTEGVGIRADEGGSIEAEVVNISGHKSYAFEANTAGSTLHLIGNHNFSESSAATGGPGSIIGSVQGDRPRSTPPSGCPRNAADAITGRRFDGWNI